MALDPDHPNEGITTEQGCIFQGEDKSMQVVIITAKLIAPSELIDPCSAPLLRRRAVLPFPYYY